MQRTDIHHSPVMHAILSQSNGNTVGALRRYNNDSQLATYKNIDLRSKMESKRAGSSLEVNDVRVSLPDISRPTVSTYQRRFKVQRSRFGGEFNPINGGIWNNVDNIQNNRSERLSYDGPVTLHATVPEKSITAGKCTRRLEKDKGIMPQEVYPDHFTRHMVGKKQARL